MRQPRRHQPEEQVAAEDALRQLHRVGPDRDRDAAGAGELGGDLQAGVAAPTTSTRAPALRGEIDITNADGFAAVLEAACGRANRTLWLDLTCVTHPEGPFVPAAGRRDPFLPRGRWAPAAHHPSPRVERLMRLMEIDALAGGHVVGGDP